MKKRILPIMFCLCFIMAMIPSAAFAGSNDNYVEIGGIKLEYSEDAAYAVTDDNGVVSVNDANEENYNIKYEDGVLYLRDANIVAQTTFGILTSGDTTIVLDGENIVKGSIKEHEEIKDLSESFGIISQGGMLTIRDGDAEGIGSLAVSGASFGNERDCSKCVSVGIYIAGSSSNDAYGLKVESGVVRAYGGEAVRSPDEENTYSYGVVSLGGISVTGGTLEAYSDTAYISTAIYADEDIDISGGKVSATSLNENFSLEDNELTVFSNGICSSYGNITISGDDTSVAASGDRATLESLGICTEIGSVVINGGIVSANQSEETYGYTTGDNSISSGIYAADDLIINGGNVTASGYDAYESYGINSVNGDITINADVYAEGGRGEKDVGGSAGIAANNGDITINKGTVYAVTSLNEGITGTGIYAKGNIFIYGGEIEAMPESSGMDGVDPAYSRGIFSEGGNVTISGANATVHSSGGAASDECTGIGTSGGDVIIQSGTVYAVGLNSYYGNNYGINAIDDNGKGGNIIISTGTVHVLGKSTSLNYTGDLTASPQKGTKIIVKTLKTLDEEDMTEDSPEMMFEKVFKKAQEIDGSPFVKETVVNKDSISDMQYFVSYAETYNVSDEGESSSDHSVKNDSIPKTGDSSEPLLWIAVALISAAAVVFIAVSGMRRIRQ